MKEIRPIVVGGNHYNTLGLVRSLGEAGYKPIVILVGDICLDNSFVARSKYIEKIRQTSLSDLIKNLLEVGDTDVLNVVFPAGDKYANIIDIHMKDFPENFILPNIDNTPGSIQHYGDKEDLRSRAEKYGFNTPSTWIMDSTNLSTCAFSFPCVIKALHSDIVGKDFGIYYNQSELQARLGELLEKTDKIQVQRFIPKDKEIIFLGWAVKNDVQIPCLMEKVREFPQKFGCTGLGVVSPDTSRFFPIENLKNLIKSYNYTGLFSVEFLISEGKAYFLEINFRNDGNGYFPGYGGVNLPATFISRLKSGISHEDLRVISSYQMMREFTDFEYMRSSGYSPLRWFKDISKTQVFQYWNRKDPMPFFFIIKSKLCKNGR